MNRLTVDIAPNVPAEVQEHVLFIARDSIEKALAWEDRVTAAFVGLQDFHGHAIDEDTSRVLGYPVRKLVFEGTYLIHYHINEAAGIVRIVQFRHGARLPRVEER